MIGPFAVAFAQGPTPLHFSLPQVFLRACVNWYKYQDDIVMNKKKLSLIQPRSMFDAGGSYLAFPRWVPFGKHLPRITFIVLGRWLGGLLGYQPHYRQWSTNWKLACDKMETSIFQKRFADRLNTE
ncbi:hypothetical protein F5Y06DRAFT_259689 [Hypoxylon sp. FL0890]|nr:hypothetical protein F5Y06DRAFT_259689 [Hypoxylon sp. FL0890]